MSRDRYSDKHIIEGIGSSTEIGIDSPKITLSSGSGLSTSGGSYLGYISVEGSANFDKPVGFNDSLYTIGTTTKLGSQYIYIGENSGDGTAEIIRISPKDGVDGDPVVIDGNLDVTGSITGVLSSSTLSEGDDFFLTVQDAMINLTATGSDGEVYIAGWDTVLHGGNSLLVESWNDLTMQSWPGTTSGQLSRIKLLANGSLDATFQNDNNLCYFDINSTDLDMARFSFSADVGPDSGLSGPGRYVVDFFCNQSSAGGHRVMRLALRGDGSEVESEGEGDGGEDFFLVCSDEVTGRTSGGVRHYYIDGEGGTGTTFTGQHWVVYNSISGASMSEDFGKIVCSTGKIYSRVSYDEALPVVKLCVEANEKTAYGVLTTIPSLAFRMKQFERFDGTYNSLSTSPEEPDGLLYSSDSPYYKARVNSLGEGSVWVTNYNGEVLNGDYITSSSIAGYGMRQDDDVLHNYTVAKCVEEIDWSSIDSTVSHDGTEYKRYLAACTYHCG